MLQFLLLICINIPRLAFNYASRTKNNNGQSVGMGHVPSVLYYLRTVISCTSNNSGHTLNSRIFRDPGGFKNAGKIFSRRETPPSSCVRYALPALLLLGHLRGIFPSPPHSSPLSLFENCTRYILRAFLKVESQPKQ